MSVRYPQVRQGEQGDHLRRILGQAAATHLGVAKLPFDHAEWVFDFGADLGLGLLDLALGLV